MLQRDGLPTALGEAIAAYGRIFKTLHILACIDADETCRCDIKHIRNLQEGRHGLARAICHGKKGELFCHYERGLKTSSASSAWSSTPSCCGPPSTSAPCPGSSKPGATRSAMKTRPG